MRQIVLDTETTGLDPKSGHRIIEIGAIELIDRQVTGKHFHSYLNPERDVEAEALKVHNISNEFLLDKPLFAHIEKEFLHFIHGAELIIHNAPFDLGFLDMELLRVNPQWNKMLEYCKVFDTLVLARKMFPGQRNSLDALCKRYSVDNTHREWHGALLDAEILARVYLAMTGGQGTLFADTFSPEKKVDHLSSTIIETKQRGRFSVIRASSDELALHEAFLKKMNKHFWKDEKEV